MDLMIVSVHSDGMFFAAYCHEAGTDVLLSLDNFISLRHGPTGPKVHYRCHCGQAAVYYPKRPAPAGGPA
jgi:hypothetical protein